MLMQLVEPEGNLVRREFLQIAAAGSVATALGPAASADPPPRKVVDVAIVGAGLAGLTAARELRKRRVTVCVLEARDRVGGRTLDHPIGGGHVVEGGGQWVGPPQTQILALAKELGIETYKSYSKGQAVLLVAGRRLTWDAGGEDTKELKRVKGALDALAKEVPLDAPWKATRAKEWDALTVADWLRKTTADADARQSLSFEIETALGKPSRVSLLYYLFYVHSAGGQHALDVEAQELRFKGGPQALSKKMAAALGTDVVLSSPVRRVVGGARERVEVESKGVCLSARRLIVAMMPADARRIEFTPALPPARRGLMKEWKGEPGFKVNVIYATPFWRKDGLSGLAVSDSGPASVTFDNSPPDGSRGVLLGFVSREQAPAGAADRRRAVLAGLTKLFGKGAAEPIGYVETDWSAEPWTAGCVSPLPPGVLTRFGASLREPVGRIHWAGTETSEVWTGYMEGAVRSGRRAAAEVGKAL
jgi:monoamine oxidase